MFKTLLFIRKHRLSALTTIAALFVLPAMVFAQNNVVSCSSDDMRRHYCDIGPNGGVTVARQHSDAQCIQGQTFGVNGNQMWVDRGCRAEFQVLSRYGRGRDGYADQGGNVNVITCSSDDMRRHFCGIPNNGRARLVRQHSDAKCVEGQTWGVSNNQLWVDRGCRADFEVRAGGRHGDDDHDRDRDRDHDGDHDRDHDQYGNGGGNVSTVTCTSDDMHRHTCNVGPNSGIRLLRQRSDAHCDLNRTYGFSGNQIWVDRGCRADFEVRSR